MGRFFAFAFLATTLSLSVNGGYTSSIEGRVAQNKLDSIYKPLQVTRAQLEKKNEASKQLTEPLETDIIQPTPVTPQESEEKATPVKGSGQLERRTWPLIPRYNVKQSRVYAILIETYNLIIPRTQNIRNLCNQSKWGANPEKLAWSLVAELRAILTILQNCLANIKSSGSAPAPSGVPNGSSPTLADICRIIFKIMCEIRECFLLIRSLCGQYNIVRTVCSDTLRQISECLCNIMLHCGLQVGNITAGLGQLFIAVPNFFVNVDFGFRGIPGILRSNNLFASFSLRL